MSLKARVKTLDDVAEAARSLYVEKDGEFVLQIEGMVSKDKLDEFRSTNIDLKKQVEALTERFDGIDPEEARKLAEKAQRDKDKKLIDAGKVDEIVTERVNAAKAGFDKERKTLEDSNRKQAIQLEGLLIDNAVREASSKSGVRSSAVDDVLLRARQVFKVVDGKAVGFDGDKELYGAKGDPMTVAEYIGTKLTEAAPHLFEPSQGGGSKKVDASSSGSSGKISRDDQAGFLSNLADIAAGKKQVA